MRSKTASGLDVDDGESSRAPSAAGVSWTRRVTACATMLGMSFCRLSRRRSLTSLGAGALLGAIGACTSSNPDQQISAAASATPPSAVETSESAASERRWPGEWEPREATLMSMPFQPAIYGRSGLDHAPARVAGGRRQRSPDSRPSGSIVPPNSSDRMRRLLGSGPDLIELEYDDGWLRDNGPIFVTGSGGTRTGLDSRFNGCGGAFDQIRPDLAQGRSTARSCY